MGGASSSTEKTTELWGPNGGRIYKDSDIDRYAGSSDAVKDMHAKQCDARVNMLNKVVNGAVEYVRQPQIRTHSSYPAVTDK